MSETPDHNAALKHGIGALITRALAAEDIEVAMPLMEAQLIVKRRDPVFRAWADQVTTDAPTQARPRGEHLQLLPKIDTGPLVDARPVPPAVTPPAAYECAHAHLEPNPLSWLGLPMCADCGRLVPALPDVAMGPTGNGDRDVPELARAPYAHPDRPEAHNVRCLDAGGPCSPEGQAAVQDSTIATDVNVCCARCGQPLRDANCPDECDCSPTVVTQQPTAHNSAYGVTGHPPECYGLDVPHLLGMHPDQCGPCRSDVERPPLTLVECVLCGWSQDVLRAEAHDFLQAHLARDHSDRPQQTPEPTREGYCQEHGKVLPHYRCQESERWLDALEDRREAERQSPPIGDCPHAWHAVTMPNGEPVEETCPQCGDRAHPAHPAGFQAGTAAI